MKDNKEFNLLEKDEGLKTLLFDIFKEGLKNSGKELDFNKISKQDIEKSFNDSDKAIEESSFFK